MQTLNLKKKYATYPEYKDSGVEWLGKIPKGWDSASTRRLFATSKRNLGETANKYKVLSLTLGGVIPRVLDGSGKNPADYATYQEFKKNDLVFCLFDYDVTPRTIGYVEEDGMMTGAYTRLIPKSETYSKYFYYYFLSLDYKKELLHLCTGLRNSIPKPLFWSMRSPLPDLEVQERIAAYLDEKTALIDQIIEKKKKITNLLREAIYSCAVEFSIKKVARNGLWEVGNNNWKFEKAKWIFKEINVRNKIEEEQLAVTQDNGVIPKRLCKEDYTSASSNENLKLVDKEDFVISLRSFQGGIEYSEYKGLVSPAYTVIRINEKYNNSYYRTYYKYLLKSPQFITILNTVISGIRDGKNINFVDFQNIILPIPPMGSLSKMESLIKKIETLSVYLKNEKALLAEYKSSLISHVVTGKIKV